MEAYPDQYRTHNLPLILLSGLSNQDDATIRGFAVPRHESGTKIACSSPECGGERAATLLEQFLRLDGDNAAWNAQTLPGPSSVQKCRMKAIGRVGTAAATSRMPNLEANLPDTHASAA